MGEKILLTDVDDGKVRLTTNTTLVEVWNVTEVLANATEVPDSSVVGLQVLSQGEGTEESLNEENVVSVLKSESVNHSMTSTAALLPVSFLREISKSEADSVYCISIVQMSL